MIDRFWSKVAIEDEGCWLWMAARQPTGYGNFWTGRRFETAHRISYELAERQPIPAGMSICHHCDNPSCVRPEHLFVATHLENVHDSVRKGRNYSHPLRSHCIHGHALTEDNLYYYPNGKRACRKCRERASANWYRQAALFT